MSARTFFFHGKRKQKSTNWALQFEMWFHIAILISLRIKWTKRSTELMNEISANVRYKIQKYQGTQKKYCTHTHSPNHSDNFFSSAFSNERLLDMEPNLKVLKAAYVLIYPLCMCVPFDLTRIISVVLPFFCPCPCLCRCFCFCFRFVCAQQHKVLCAHPFQNPIQQWNNKQFVQLNVPFGRVLIELW